MKALPGVQVDGKVYLVPADAGTAGIMYNADVVTTPPDFVARSVRPAVGREGARWKTSPSPRSTSAPWRTASPTRWTMTTDQLDQVKNYLIDHRDQFRTFWKGGADIKIAVQVRRGRDRVRLSRLREGSSASEGVNAQFAVAKEGQMLWTCGYGISPDAENLDAAYALLNWYSSLPPQVYAATEFNYITSNMKVGDAADAGGRSRTPGSTRSVRRPTRSRRARPTIARRGSRHGPR